MPIIGRIVSPPVLLAGVIVFSPVAQLDGIRISTLSTKQKIIKPTKYVELVNN